MCRWGFQCNVTAVLRAWKGAVKQPVGGGQFDFVWLSARAPRPMRALGTCVASPTKSSLKNAHPKNVLPQFSRAFLCAGDVRRDHLRRPAQQLSCSAVYRPAADPLPYTTHGGASYVRGARRNRIDRRSRIIVPLIHKKKKLIFELTIRVLTDHCNSYRSFCGDYRAELPRVAAVRGDEGVEAVGEAGVGVGRGRVGLPVK